MKMLRAALVLVMSSIVAGQRGSFAGIKPIGFPDTPNRTTTTQDPLADRFGEGTSEVLPVEANGDRDLIDRLSKLPIDKQPFWYINWQPHEKQWKEPQTYPLKPNSFVDPIISNPIQSNSGQVNNRFSTATPEVIGTESGVFSDRFGPTAAPSQPSNNVSPNSNFNSNAYTNIYPSSNVYDNGNSNPNSNIYNNNNPTSNVYTPTNSNTNLYPSSNPTGNSNPNLYLTGNSNSNLYPTGNSNSNLYPVGNPTGNPNSNVYQTSNLNSQSNFGAANKNGASFQKTQKYQWPTHFMTSNMDTATTLKNHPAFYPQTDTFPQRSGRELF